MRLFVLVGLLAACQTPVPHPPVFINDNAPRSAYEAHAPHGMVTTAHPLATEAGLAMLRKGGNAVDAAAAVSFVLGVVKPHSTGIGGGGFLLFYPAKTQQTVVYDFRERAPLAATRKMYLEADGKPKDFVHGAVRLPLASVNGPLSVGVPGLVAGVVKAHREHGVLPLATVMAPAIAAARNGFIIYPSLAKASKDRFDVLNAFPASRAIFLPKGQPLQVGERLVQTDLAATLELIASEGEKPFYHGSIAAKIVASQQNQGLVTQQDFAGYEVKMRQPVTGIYRGYRIVAMPPPSSGGVHIVQILHMYEHLAGPQNPAPAQPHLLAEVLKRAFQDRAKYMGDPDFHAIPVAGLLSENYLTDRVGTIDRSKATEAASIPATDPVPYESKLTSHFSIVDQQGNAVSSTQTINYSFGSGVVAAGTGIMLNNEMDDFSVAAGVPNVYNVVTSVRNAIAGKKTMLSSMAPTLVFDPKGRLQMVVGAAGGPRIITASAQTILNVIEHGMNLADAVHHLRMHHQWFPDELVYEKGLFSPAEIADLERKGQHLHEVANIGSEVEAIGATPDGWVGVADSRTEGRAAGL